eukprot:CAMPEP_0206055338 /NCGR_PEP_ID=MMETSP1466-20131121/39903_1 /ASSEMBLY_ACC=CAM_ASM_001126 /TAXON_ID=44452 /ORGANISM="Pavlova gyrans, Strain CCMP608" /LENGTH=91 /DNA_ID=CAMNT_0053430563 /DNA_START=28 /DNA_END=299 /DNA_ORIENTATION=-
MSARMLAQPLCIRVLDLAAPGLPSGMPRRVKVVTWGAPLNEARYSIIYAGGAPTSAEHEAALHSVGSGSTDVYKERSIHLIAIDKPGMGGT